MLRAAELVTTPLLPADYLDLISPLRAGADLRGRIVDIRRETADAVTLVIRPGRGWLGHVPGQYIRIGGLTSEVDDAAAQVGAGAQRADQVEVVGGQKRGRHQLGRPQGPGGEGRSSRGCSWSTHVFYYHRF